ncbi:hypothetical protein D049_3969B, partial [Vibrio parahaemolyticus VPTS-2010]
FCGDIKPLRSAVQSEVNLTHQARLFHFLLILHEGERG